MANPWEIQFENAAEQLYLSTATFDASAWPEAFFNDEIDFIDAWVQTVMKEFSVEGQSPKDPVAGIVLRVREDTTPSPMGTIGQINELTRTGPSKRVLQVWVHTQFDEFLGMPTNFLTPSAADLDIIEQHPVCELSAHSDISPPSPGDIVKVRHAWSKGFSNRVGEYIGKIANGMPPTLKEVAASFKKAAEKKCGGRRTDIPGELAEPLAEPLELTPTGPGYRRPATLALGGYAV